MPDFPTIDTPRLRLREITPEDAEVLLSIHGDQEAMKWFGCDPLTDLDQAKKLVETFAEWRTTPNPGTRWGIQLNDTSELIGSCGLFKWNRSWRSCTLGYELSRSATGHGYMREALNAVLPWGFKHMSLNRIEAQIHPLNRASIRSVEALGFKQEGVMRHAGYWLGAYHDLVLFSLLRSEYQIT
ncbi:GNAT family N-acetyltransferase [Glaciimonas sp. GG7]